MLWFQGKLISRIQLSDACRKVSCSFEADSLLLLPSNLAVADQLEGVQAVSSVRSILFGVQDTLRMQEA